MYRIFAGGGGRHLRYEKRRVGWGGGWGGGGGGGVDGSSIM